ncbi:MAG: hypothetical protein L0213_15050, partial [Candidatus Dadabacteria bacterium]|nr:hypothetical protein [Candidatus Dadabacteria bacterium]
MPSRDIENLISDIEELRKAVRNNSPFLRALADSRLFAAFALPMGVFILVFCVGTHYLLAARGSFDAVPGGWKLAFWIFMGAFTLVAGIGKIFIMKKRAAEVKSDATFATVVKAMYGGVWFHVNVPLFICMFTAVAFPLYLGHPWYIIPGTSIFLGIISNALWFLFRRAEYLVMGWFSLVVGIASLFFVESAPWLWAAFIYGGAFLGFGIVGLLTPASPRRTAGPETMGDS